MHQEFVYRACQAAALPIKATHARLLAGVQRQRLSGCSDWHPSRSHASICNQVQPLNSRLPCPRKAAVRST